MPVVIAAHARVKTVGLDAEKFHMPACYRQRVACCRLATSLIHVQLSVIAVVHNALAVVDVTRVAIDSYFLGKRN